MCPVRAALGCKQHCSCGVALGQAVRHTRAWDALRPVLRRRAVDAAYLKPVCRATWAPSIQALSSLCACALRASHC